VIPFDEITGALISLIIGTLLGSELTRYLYRPRVFIRYEDVTPLYAPDGVHWTIQVANFGRTVASECKGIISIDNLTADDLMPIGQASADEVLPSYKSENADIEFPRAQHLGPDSFRSITNEELAWAATGNPAKVAINPGITEKLDVFKVQNELNDPYILVPSGTGWRKLRARIKPVTLKGRIMICPSNEFPTVMFFTLTFDRTGKSFFRVRRPGPGQKLKRLLFRRRFYYG
jgi:hypothetical protein